MFINKFLKQSVIISSIVLFFIPIVVSASDVLKGVSTVTQKSYGTTVDAADSERQLNLWIGWVIKVALSWVGVILLGIIIYAGYMWLTAGGNEEQVKTAMSWIRNAVIGMIIITAAFFISDYVLEALSGTQAY